MTTSTDRPVAPPSEPRARRHLTAYLTTAAALLAGCWALRGSTWQGSVHLHTLLEVVATLLALAVGALGLVRYHARRANVFLFVGAGFLGTGVLDLYHAVVTSEWFGELWPSPPASLIPWSWGASRLFLSVLLALSWWAAQREERLGTAGAVPSRRVYAAVAGLTAACFAFFAVVPLPRAYYPELPLGRPQELLPALLFGVSLLGYLRRGRWRFDPFEHWLVLCLVVSVVGQGAFMSTSERLFDAQFDAAHLLKKASYACVLTGLLSSLFQTLREGEGAARRLAEREGRYRQVVAHTDTGFVVVDPRGRVLEANEPYLRLIGRADLAAVLGRSVLEWTAPECVEENVAAVRRCAESGSVTGFRTAYLRPDGSRVELSIDATAEPGPDGARLVALCRDVTAAEEARRALEQSEAKYRHLLENVPQKIFYKDADSVYVAVNPSYAGDFGLAPEAFPGKTDFDLYPAELAEKYRADDRRVMGAGQVEVLDESYWHGGEERTVHTVKVPVRDGAGRATGVLGVFWDITDRKRAEAELARTAERLGAANRALAKKNAELDEFTYVASHDLQEPLRKLSAFSRIVEEDLGEDLTDDTRENLGFIVDAAERMQALVLDLLALSRTGRLVRRVPVDLGACADAALTVLSDRVAETGAEVARDPLPTVVGDPMLLTQLYQNLIGNALKFRGDRPPRIRLTAAQEEGAWVLGVADRGIGMKPEYAEQIFLPFKRLHGRTEYPGTGIGLAICKKAVESHGGRIWVESALGQGAHFRFTLSGADGPDEEARDVGGEPV